MFKLIGECDHRRCLQYLLSEQSGRELKQILEGDNPPRTSGATAARLK
jgi:hypothetical protein